MGSGFEFFKSFDKKKILNIQKITIFAHRKIK